MGALYFQGTGGLFSGLDSGSALFAGARGTYDVRGGVRLAVHRSRRVQLSTRLGVRNALGLSVVPADLAVSVLDDPQASLPDLLAGSVLNALLARERLTVATGGMAVAWTLSERVGLQGSISSQLGRRAVSGPAVETAGLSGGVGGGVSVDVRPTNGPLGVQVGLLDRLERDAAVADLVASRNHLLFTGQLYHDRPEVQLSLVVQGAALSAGSEALELGVEGRAVTFF